MLRRDKAARQVSQINQNEGRVKHGDGRLRQMLRRAKERRGYNIGLTSDLCLPFSDSAGYAEFSA